MSILQQGGIEGLGRATRPGRLSIAATAATVLLALFTARALIHPLILYDEWWYHLPFSSWLFDIGGGRDAFHMSAMLEERFRGFPKLWEWVQGAAWKSSGTLRGVAWPQIALVYAYIYAISREFEIPPSWTWLAFFASPLLLIHFVAAYSDLPVAVGAAAGALLFLKLVATSSEAEGFWPRAGWAAAAFALAGNIKYQGLIAVVAVSLVLAGLTLVSPIVWRMRARLLAGLVIANAAASFTCTANLVEYRNPLYPIEVRAMGRTVFAGPESADYEAAFPAYVSPSGAELHLPEPINFLLSASELDFALRGAPFGYNVDQVAGMHPTRGAPARTGGWGALFVLANAAALLAQVFWRRREADPAQRLYVVGAVLIVVVTALLPRAHELRYWLFVPLLVSAVNLRALARSSRRETVALGLVALAFASVALCLASPKAELLTFRPIDAAHLSQIRPARIVEALARNSRYCDAGDETLFLYSSAASGQPGLLSSRPEDCR